MKINFKIKILLLLVLFFALAGCSKKQSVNMDEKSNDGNYHYSNKDLEFSVVLPPEFIYYQTQREEFADYIDIEFFVPTNDLTYIQKVQNYAEPFYIRVYKKNAPDDLEQDDNITVLDSRGGNIYIIRFWDKESDDWKDKWNKEMKENIIKNFSLN